MLGAGAAGGAHCKCRASVVPGGHSSPSLIVTQPARPPPRPCPPRCCAVVSRDPLRLAITRSATHKGELRREDILEIEDGLVVTGDGAASAETALHLRIVAGRGAGAVLHTHSIWSTLLSQRYAEDGG